MSNPTGRAAQPPWANSAALGGEFIYDPRTDEIVLKEGLRRLPRPLHILESSLNFARWTGPLPQPQFQYTGSPPGNGGNYSLAHGRPQAIPAPANQDRRLPAGMTPVGSGPQGQGHFGTSPSGSPSAGPHLDGTMGRMRLGPNQKPTQYIHPKREIPAVFHQRTQSQIARRDPVRPDTTVRGIPIGNEQALSTLFPEYMIHPRRFFAVGRIFLVLWSEPAGGASLVTGWQSGIVLNHMGERVFSKVRRFVVIRADDTYCTALPINTYGGRGVAKKNIKKSDHCIIWSNRPGRPSGQNAAPVPRINTAPHPAPAELPKRNEDGMRPVPIRVDPDKPTEHLDAMSRLNLGGVTTVQHNIKVKSFGMVNQQSVRDLEQQFNNVWGRVPLPAPPGLPSNDDEDEEEDEEEEEEEDSDDESGDDEQR